MANKKLTWDAFKNHLHYGKWVYLVIALVAGFGFDLVYQMTSYRAPEERKTDFYLVQGGYVDVEALDGLAAYALKAGQAYDPTLEEVNFLDIAYSGDSTQDYYGAQKYGVMLQANQGDVWIMPRVLFEQLYALGSLLPLDPYIESGLLDASALNLSDFTRPASSGETDENDELLPPDGPIGVYALPVSAIGALEGAGFVLNDACIILMPYSSNPETSIAVLNSLIGQTALMNTADEAQP